MIKQFDLKQWQRIHMTILELVIPIIFVMCGLYTLLVTTQIFFVIFSPILYFLIAAISRETFWISDYYMSRIVGYETMQSYLWKHIVKPPRRITTIKMFYLWMILLRPEWECRVRRLKRMSHHL